MSKLFETLETIRRRESTGSQRLASPRAAPPPGRPNQRLLLRFLIVLLVCGGFVYGLRYALDRPVRPNGPAALPESPAPHRGPARVTAAPPGQAAEVVASNNRAVAYIRNHDHWRGIYLLTTLVDRHPERIEPLINLGVALAEVGLWEPAREYLFRARALNPAHPLLRENLAILKRAGLLDEFPRPTETGGRDD